MCYGEGDGGGNERYEPINLYLFNKMEVDKRERWEKEKKICWAVRGSMDQSLLRFSKMDYALDKLKG